MTDSHSIDVMRSLLTNGRSAPLAEFLLVFVNNTRHEHASEIINDIYAVRESIRQKTPFAQDILKEIQLNVPLTNEADQHLAELIREYSDN